MLKRYDIKYKDENNIGNVHTIFTKLQLTKNELDTLAKISLSLPHSNIYPSEIWRHKLLKLDLKLFPKKLLSLAVNAFDSTGRTVLGTACEYGYSVSCVQKLIDMGADLNRLDANDKLPIHWAICNRFSLNDPESYEAAEVVQCLLQNGAKLGIVSYQNMNPYEYAKSRGYIAGMNIIEHYNKQHSAYTCGAVVGLLQDFFSAEISAYLAHYLSDQDSAYIVQTRKEAYMLAHSEKDTFDKKNEESFNTSIKEHRINNASYTRGAAIGLFNGIFVKKISARISSYLHYEDSRLMAQVNKSAYETAHLEKNEAEYRITRRYK